MTLIDDLTNISRLEPWRVRDALAAYIEMLKAQPAEEKGKGTRTYSQNKALWLWLTMLADVLNTAGLDMKAVLKADVDIAWTKASTHDYLWIPIQKAALGTDSTTELNKLDIDTVRDHIVRHLAEKFPGIDIPPFPSYATDQDAAPLIDDVEYRV